MTVKKWAERALGGLMESEAGEWVHEADYDALAARMADSERLREDERLTWDAQHKRQASMNAHLAALVTDAQEELRKCQQDAIQLQARLAHAEACLAEKHLRLAEAEAATKTWENEAERRSRRYEKTAVRLAEADALLREARKLWGNDAKCAMGLDDLDTTIAAFLAADSATHRETARDD